MRRVQQTGLKTHAPDIGHGPVLQEKRWPAKDENPPFDGFALREPVSAPIESGQAFAQKRFA
jgi:hypothetical protein